MKMISRWLSVDVFADLSIKMSQNESSKEQSIKIFLFLTNLNMVCETFGEYDGSTTPDNLPSYTVRFVNKNFAIV